MTITIIYVVAALILLAMAKGKEKPEHEYNAQFGRLGEHFGYWNHGFSIGNLALTRLQSFQNLLLCGPTGSGKGSTVIMNSIVSLSRNGSSMLINDISGGEYFNRSSYLREKGYTILRFDFSNAEFSEAFNPILFCKTQSDIQQLCLIVMRNSTDSKGSDPFWEQASISLLSLMMRLLVFHFEPKYRTFKNVLRLIEKFAVNPEVVDKLMVRTRDEELLDQYKALLVVGDKTLQSVVISTRVALNLFSDPEVCRTTATNSIDFNILREKPVAIFICNPLQHAQYYKPLTCLFFQCAFNFVLSKIPPKRSRGIFFLLDEAAVMKFPSLSNTISNIRKFRGGIMLAMQDEQALTAQYGPHEAHQVITNCSCKIYLPGQPLATCTDLSKMLGRYTYENDKKSKTRELMTVDEIRTTESALILVNNSLPLIYEPTPYFRSLRLWKIAHAKPVELQARKIQEPAELEFV